MLNLINVWQKAVEDYSIQYMVKNKSVLLPNYFLIIQNEKYGMKIPVHKTVLSCYSLKFQELFESKETEIRIENVSHFALITFLLYVYNNVEKISLNFDIIWDVLKLDRDYKAISTYTNKSIQEICCEFLASNINDKNVFEIFSKSIKINLFEIETKCLDFIKKSTTRRTFKIFNSNELFPVDLSKRVIKYDSNWNGYDYMWFTVDRPVFCSGIGMYGRTIDGELNVQNSENFIIKISDFDQVLNIKMVTIHHDGTPKMNELLFDEPIWLKSNEKYNLCINREIHRKFENYTAYTVFEPKKDYNYAVVEPKKHYKVDNVNCEIHIHTFNIISPILCKRKVLVANKRN